jgi:hypothetical protein
MLPLELLIQTKFLQKLILPSQLQESLQELLVLTNPKPRFKTK